MGDALPYVDLGAGRSARALAAGSDVTCGVLDDGSVKCWGYNGYGAVGAANPNSFGITAALAPLPAGRKGVAVGAGSGYGFALLDDGSLGRWGREFSAYALPTGERVRSFDRSPRYEGYHLCALFEAGSVRCWPVNQFVQDMGQFGWAYDASVPPESYPTVRLGTGRTASQVALGDVHTCALLDNGAVKCWGANDKGQLGVGDVFARGAAAADMGDALPAVALGVRARAIAAGGSHTCALLTSGAVKCWGSNDSGQLGQGHTQTLGDQPGELEALSAIDLGPGRSATAIDVGEHSCAVLDNGAVKCWGTNTSGELGQGDLLSRGAAAGTMGAALPEIALGE
jgi:alpha-tubulin suppressor-like RCC1 family protein